jgi:hypothetical protein
MTIYSFHKLNPDWKIKLYVPKNLVKNSTWDTGENSYLVTKECYMDEVKKLPIEIIENDMTKFGYSAELPEVQKSDIFRWHILSSEGGFWGDMDILFDKPLNDLYFNKKGSNITDTICVYDNNRNTWHSIGFILAQKNSPFYKEILEHCKPINDNTDYQAYGSTVLKTLYPDYKKILKKYPTMENLKMDVVYQYSALLINRPWDVYSTANVATSNTIGIHWYAGNPKSKEIVSMMTRENRNHMKTNIFTAILDKIEAM